ncbi:S8 family serine peptidase [Isoptericola sp. b490]|uniref:S8 family serine peptidase n=1 Tax=Actinotalea lenta TaxID=3064654 RepID=UPI0027126802|nr:S8 family serine peptidase [Isoptericola sp. b490]MDO8119974.1 S8 family serine peptidase [Isoptericola sp. b490]
MRALILVLALGVAIVPAAPGAAAPGAAAPGVPVGASAADAPTPDRGADRPDGASPTPHRTGLEEIHPAAPQDTTIPGEVVVRFAPGVSAARQAAALSAAGVRTRRTASRDGALTTTVTVAPERAEQAAAALAAAPGVVAAQVAHRRSVAGWTDDPLLDEAWPYFALTELPRAWDADQGAGVVVAVLDTGVSAHPDLAGALLPGVDLVDNDSDPSDPNGHGTAVAGVVAARGDNGLGAVGSAPAASVLPVRVADANGQADDAVIAAGIDWAVAHGADVINISLGGPSEAPVLLAAMRDAVAAGAVVVVAAGNDGTEAPEYPAAYAPLVDGVIAVGATDDAGRIEHFSSSGDWVTLAAPGRQLGAPAPGGGYVWATGTSFSAPLAAGVAALVEEAGTTDPAAVQRALTRSARDAGPRGLDPWYGAGVVDAAAALGLVTAVPLDRATGDGGPEDGLPGQAQPLAAGTDHEATLAPEGDVDWYRVELGAGMYQAVVTPGLDPVTGIRAQRPVVIVLDAAGHRIESTASAPAQPVSAAFALSGPGSVDVGVRDTSGVVTRAPYDIRVEPASAVAPFTRDDVRTTVIDPRLAVADVTGDGRPDAVVAQPGAVPEVRAGRDGGAFGDAVAVAGSLAASAADPVSADVDGDGRPEVLIATSAGVTAIDAGATGPTATALVTVPGGASAIVAGDMDGDHDPDLLLGTADGLVVYRNDAGTFTPAGTVGSVTDRFAVGDLNGDGLGDVVDVTGQVFLQRGDGSFSGPTPIPETSTQFWGVTCDIAVGDVTGDHRADIVRSRFSDVYVSAGRGDGTFDAPIGYSAGYTADAMALADIDGDGRTDVAVGDGGWSVVSLLYQQADGSLGAPVMAETPYSSQYWPGSLQAVDLNGDGAVDLALAGAYLLTALIQQPADPAPWFVDASTAPHRAGLAVRPTLRFESGRDLDPASVAGATRLVADDGSAVAVHASWDATAHTLAVTPVADLLAGHHYELVVDGLRDLGGDTQAEPYRTWFTVAAGGDRFTPVTPWRVLDTRNGTGFSGALQPGVPRTLTLGGAWVPPGTDAVVLNVTAVAPSGTGNIRVYPTTPGGSPPTVSNLNVVRGVDQPNLVTVPLGDDGTVTLLASAVQTHVVADLAGYYSPGGAAGYTPATSVRLMDTRYGTGGVPARRLAAGHWVDLQVTGRAGVPADAVSVVLNVTGVAPGGRTNIRVYPTPAASESQDPPTVSNLNVYARQDQPNLVTVAVGDGGRVRFYTQSADVHLIADLAGYYSAHGTTGFVPVDPSRIADTRRGTGIAHQLQPGAVVDLAVAGRGGIAPDAEAAVLNVTAVNPGGSTNVRVFPAGTAQVPTVSTLNVVAHRDQPNLAVPRLGPGGGVSVYSQTAPLDLVVDVAGYFTR